MINFSPVCITDFQRMSAIAQDERIMEYACSFYCASAAAGWKYQIAYIHEQGQNGFVLQESLADGVGYVLAGTMHLQALCNALRAIDGSLKIRYVDARRLADFLALPGFAFAQSFQEQYSDYLVARADFINLKGDKNKHKRYKYNKFVRNAAYTVQDIAQVDPRVTMQVMQKWCDLRDCATCSYDCEQDILAHMLQNCARFGLQGKVVFVEDVPVALSVSEVRGDMAYSFHAKADERYEGLAVFVRVALAESLTVQTLNCGYDAGVAGVRAFKNMFKPYTLLHKYELNTN